MTFDAVTRDEALQTFGRRFQGMGLSNSDIAERFDQLLEARCLDFHRSDDGELRVVLCERRSRQ